MTQQTLSPERAAIARAFRATIERLTGTPVDEVTVTNTAIVVVSGEAFARQIAPHAAQFPGLVVDFDTETGKWFATFPLPGSKACPRCDSRQTVKRESVAVDAYTHRGYGAVDFDRYTCTDCGLHFED